VLAVIIWRSETVVLEREGAMQKRRPRSYIAVETKKAGKTAGEGHSGISNSVGREWAYETDLKSS